MNALGIMKPPHATRVVVAMSGGVDSATVAALLKEAGYDVVGITLQLYDARASVAASKTCCAGRDIHDARRIAQELDIPHYVLDYQERFGRDVVREFARSYARGETPIPCVLCNRTVKFRDLLACARDIGADAMATGHYVRRIAGPDGPELHAAREVGRDQSYFLFGTTPAELDWLRFPLGDLTKGQVRAEAARLGVPVAEKPDSQDICFVPDGDYAALVARLEPAAVRPGEIVDEAGQVLGRHDGIVHFTVGQRRGLGLSSREPFYVVAIEAEAARIVVGPKAALDRRAVPVRDVNWLSAPPGANGRAVTVKLRSAQAALPALLHAEGAGATVHLAAPPGAVAPGQACVFYDGTRVLGGGWIGHARGSAGTAAAASSAA